MKPLLDHRFYPKLIFPSNVKRSWFYVCLGSSLFALFYNVLFHKQIGRSHGHIKEDPGGDLMHIPKEHVAVWYSCSMGVDQVPTVLFQIVSVLHFHLFESDLNS